MPTTWTALLLLLVAVLPGAAFTFAFERQAGSFGVTRADRALRFVGVSLAFDAVYAWPAWLAYDTWLAQRPFATGEFALAWSGAVLAVALPTGVGTVTGGLYATRTTRDGWRWVRRWLSAETEARLLQALLGREPAPHAWDNLFSGRPTAFLRIRLPDGGWMGGLFAAESAAGRFPQDGDLLIEEAWPIDAAGQFGDTPLGYAVWVPASSIAYMEIVEGSEEEASHA